MICHYSYSSNPSGSRFLCDLVEGCLFTDPSVGNCYFFSNCFGTSFIKGDNLIREIILIISKYVFLTS